MSLCDRCNHSLVYQQKTRNRVTYNCLKDSTGPVPPDIIRCSQFEDRAHPTLWHMHEIAWSVVCDPRNGRVKGFTPPEPPIG